MEEPCVGLKERNDIMGLLPVLASALSKKKKKLMSLIYSKKPAAEIAKL